MNEAELIRKLKLIEALRMGGTTPGEKQAAAEALKRIQNRLNQEKQRVAEQPVEYTFTLPDMWRRKLFTALLRRYGIQPYRYARQRHTTVMARASKPFVKETLWSEYQEISQELSRYLEEATDRIISQAIHADYSEAAVVNEPKQIEKPD